MANVLEKIVENKRNEIAARKTELPLNSFIDQLMPSERSFYAALAKPNAGFVFECKKASPSKGLIRANFDLDEIIDAYSPYAACISVLTDEKYFQGKFEYLEYVRRNLDQPVLNKDFFVDPYQIYLARYHNADAVLLMLSVLDDGEYQQLAMLADKFALDVLTEVSNELEAKRAVALGAKIIGINNRDLRDLSTDLATTERLVPLLKQLGHDGIIISESGIYTHKDVLRLAKLVDGFLVGSSVMAEPNVKIAVKKLLYGEVKVCGITRIQDAEFVSQCGATYAGLIFAEQSKRVVSFEQAMQIVSDIPFNYVGVFVDQSATMVAEYANKLQLSAVQLHGNEDQAYIDVLRSTLSKECQIWKAIGVSDKIPEFNYQNIDRILLDCKVGNQSGGTGQSFDWRLLHKDDQPQFPTDIEVFLAGGIDVNNIQNAIATGVTGLDLNSGVESAPGIKDHEKITQAFKQLRAY